MLREKKVRCIKYNYCFEECVQNFNNYQCQISIDDGQLVVQNLKQNEWMKSNATSRFEDITGFMYGPQSSRFDVLKKQINSMSWDKFAGGDAPFYAWQCISI